MQQLVRFFMRRRVFNLCAFLACVGLILAALFFEHYQGENPCPLCLLQRYGIIAVGIVYLLAGIFHSNKVWVSRIFAVLLLLTAIIGGAMSGRHIWIQSLPEDQVPACTAPLHDLAGDLGWKDTLELVLIEGTGDCHDSSWKFLYLTMPMWVLVWFIGFGIFGFLRNWIPDDNSRYHSI